MYEVLISTQTFYLTLCIHLLSKVVINARCHLTGEIIDKENGIYAVFKLCQGHSIPGHVQLKTWGTNHNLLNAAGEHDCSSGKKSEEGSGPVHHPKGAMLQEIVSHIQEKKKFPTILPEDIKHPVLHRVYSRHLVPDETLCQNYEGIVPLVTQ